MRTTLDIPDALFRQAKRVAFERGITLKALVARGLEKELGISPETLPTRLSRPPITLSENSLLRRSSEPSASSLDQREAAELDAVYRRH